MVLTHPFYCPVRCVEGHGYDEALPALLGGRPYALVTSAGWLRRGAGERIAAQCGAPRAVVASIEANPTVSCIVESAPEIAGAEIVVALGGGSVIDAAKGMTAFNALGRDTAGLSAHLRDGAPLPADLAPAPIIAVPTTSGTGSEVTRWGTIWGDDGIKHSVTAPALYPREAVLDPALTVSMPHSLTLSTGLDALSHAMEAVWNRRHGETTDMLCEQAIRLIRTALPAVLEQPGDLALRRRMQSASVLAGLAMGATQTALAHSISYPFTARFGVPHGLACSFTLAEVIRFNAESDPDRLQPIARAFEAEVPHLADTVEAFLVHVGAGTELARYVDSGAAEQFGDNLITRARAANNVREIDGPGAKTLTARALGRLLDTAAR